MAAVPLFEIHDATVMRAGRPILHVDDFSLAEGEHVALLGPNGAGKSTFVHLLTREAFPLFKEHPPVRFRGQDRPLLTDLKGALGIVSSTMHEQVRVHLPAIDIVCGGLFGTLGLPRHVTCSETQRALGMAQLAKLGVGHVADRDIMTLSSGKRAACWSPANSSTTRASSSSMNPAPGSTLKGCTTCAKP